MRINDTTKPAILELDFAGTRHFIAINAQKRRSFRLRINSQQELELLTPMLYGYQLKDFLYSHQNWLIEQVKLRLNELKIKAEIYQFQGQKKPIVAQEIKQINEHAYELWVSDCWDTKQIISKVNQHKRKQAYILAYKRLDYWWPKFPYQIKPPTLRIKNMHTRWGSLSSKHNLNLSLELFSHPLEQIDLVLVHELCHIQHMNHSAEFYALMQSILPDWQVREAKLKQPPN